ncbi:hypothetical protein Ddye_014377 [Dipteronia dyeriana]|uniref:Neprosin PEP catalytic domain-containing protein n=1 Tax=Dipteronia dyeriana TaxID=168575 RepID=A0AAE0CKJ6_9ROSI|nr:hypothetical protein Ddye_014377 [Dipteronia dyeriana]
MPNRCSLQSDDGDVIDCVEIDKQPAFNHPLLRNHSIQMKPNFHPSGSSENNKNPVIFQSWHKNGECPEGTIPITRTQKFNYPLPSHPPIRQPNHTLAYIIPPRHEYAQLTLEGDIFFGAHAYINVWNPITLYDEFSRAQVWVLEGHNQDLNSIEAGWMEIIKVKGGDNLTRLFVHWTSDGYQNTGCYNLQCPGFVQIDKGLALGGLMEPVSSYNGSQFEILLIVKRDQNTGNWWLKVGDRIVGYWPHYIFSTGFQDSGTEIKWGGAVLNKNFDNHHTATQMGSGHFPGEEFGKASYIRNLGYYDYSNKLVTEGLYIDSIYATRPSCYDIKLAEHGKQNHCPAGILHGAGTRHRDTAQSDNGDVIDRVEINKQPAFNHPLLRNHSIQVKGGDNLTRLFVHWTSDGYQNTGCYNLQCPGFVQIDKGLALGGLMEPVSSYNGSQFEILLIVKRDQVSGNWWLTIQDKIIGYWPGSLFTGLADMSTEIIWGGVVLNSNVGGHHTATQMGSGHFPGEGIGNASYNRNMGLYNNANILKTNMDVQSKFKFKKGINCSLYQWPLYYSYTSYTNSV